MSKEWQVYVLSKRRGATVCSLSLCRSSGFHCATGEGLTVSEKREGKAPAAPRHLARAEASLRCGRSLTLPMIEIVASHSMPIP
jgi:hypothetical protein